MPDGLDFSPIPGHIAHMQAPSDPTELHQLQPGEKPRDYHPLDLGAALNRLTEPIENYTPEGRAEHPILSRIGDVTRGAKELLEGGQAAGKPLGTSSGTLTNPVTQIIGMEDAPEKAAAVEEKVREYAPKIGEAVTAGARKLTEPFVVSPEEAEEAMGPEAGKVRIRGKKVKPSAFDAIPGHREEVPKPPVASEESAGEIAHLEGVLRDPKATPTEREVATRQLEDYRTLFNQPGSPGIMERIAPPPTKPAAETPEWQLKEQDTEIQRLEGILRNPEATENDRQVASDQLKTIRGEAPATKPNDQVAGSAQRYNSSRGNPEIDHTPKELPSQEDRNEMADAYDRAKHEPERADVARAYDAMKRETLEQFNHAKNDLGIKFDFTEKDPYETAHQMQADVRNNHHLSTFTGGTPLAKDHPLAEIEPTTGQSYNNIFRATHDIYGHSAGGHDFSEAGEESAYQAHRQMYSPEARPAVQNETQGQANWYFNNARARAGAEKDFPEQKATILPETRPEEVPVQEEEGDTSFEFGANVPEQEPTTGYHPDLQKVVDQYGETDSPYQVSNGASFITPSGKFVHLGSAYHSDAIDAVRGEPGSKGVPPDSRISFLNDTGVIRTRASFDKGGHTLHVSVPAGGVSSAQIDALKQAAQKVVGKSGHIVMERADVNVDNVDKLTKDEWLGNANTIEPMLHAIEAHPDDRWDAQAGLRAAKEPAGGIDPRTGKSDTEGHGTEIMPEKRVALDRAPTKEDFASFFDANKELFAAHPELRVGWDNNSNVPGGHEINIGAVGKGAKKVAQKLEQRAAFDIGEGKDIPTGGTGLRTEFHNYPLEERLKDLRGEPQSTIPGFESLSKEFHENLEPDERAYLKDNNLLQSNAMKQYHNITPSVAETTNAMQAGAALGGWWQRYIDVFHGLADGGKAAAKKIGPSHAEVLKQWHAAVSGNKSVEDANNLAWHSYADWLDAGKPTDRKSIDDIVRKNGAQPAGSPKKGNAAISDTRNKKGKVISPGLDTGKLYLLVNSPEMKGTRPFHGDVFSDEVQKNPLMGSTEGARKIPSMGATVAGKGNLNRLVIDAHIRDFYGYKQSSGPAAQYIADSVHLRQAAKALGLKGGEGQEQLWGTVLGLKMLLKQGLIPEEASGKLNADVIHQIGKDYAEVIANDPEITKPGGVLDRLRKLGVGQGSAGVSRAYSPAQLSSAGTGGPGPGEVGVDPSLLAKTAERIRGQIAPKKIKKPAESKQQASEEGLKWLAEGTKTKYLPPK